MRQPTFSRSRRRARQQRLLRTGIVVALVVASAAIAVSLLSGGGAGPGGNEDVAQVSFDATVTGYGDRTPPRGRIQEEGSKIVEQLDDWYQRAFVDPSLYGDGTFPEIAEKFEEAARERFTADLAALTIGDARTEVAGVDPEEAVAEIGVYFDKGTTPAWASAKVRFSALGRMKDAAAFPLRIQQQVTLFFKLIDGDWLVSTYYQARQTQDSVVPSPSPSESAT